MRTVVLAFAFAATACGTSGTLTSPPTTTPFAASRAPDTVARVIAGVPPSAIASPDGRWLATLEPPPVGKSPYAPTVLLYDAKGTFVARVVIGGGVYGWLPDSSGLYAATMLPQKAPPLAIIENDGRVTTTEIQFSNTVLSRDGRWLISDQQERCCMDIVQRELRVSPRSGGPSRSLVMSASTTQQPVALLGIDASDRVLYRDGDSIRRIALAGGGPETLASRADLVRTSAGGTSPDRTVLLVRGYEPSRWYVAANDRVSDWDDTAGELVTSGAIGVNGWSRLPIWTGPHTVLVRLGGRAVSYDVASGARAVLPVGLHTTDGVLAYAGGRLLLFRSGRLALVDTRTGIETETGIASDAGAMSATALPSGALIVGAESGTYRID